MTIREYLDNLPDMENRTGRSLRDAMMDATGIWSNAACRGYCLIAMERAGLDEETQERVLRAMRGVFDEVTVGEAERIGG